MRKLSVSSQDENKRIDRYIGRQFEKMPQSALYKAFRKKDIKVNGKWVREDYLLRTGDVIDVYVKDDILDGYPLSGYFDPGFSVIYEDDNLMIVNKKQGISVHADDDGDTNTVIHNIHRYLLEKGELAKISVSGFTPSLCHRLDRNTGGLLLISKNRISFQILVEKIAKGEIQKFYLCYVTGKMDKKEAKLRAYLKKEEKKSKVFISSTPKNGYVEIITSYKELLYDAKNDISKLEIHLHTGRTHQIRAHLAFLGHPIVGDGKYGKNEINRHFGLYRQVLFAYKLHFSVTASNHLSYLDGRIFALQPDFMLDEYRK